MIVLLDDIGAALYKKLKKEADELVRIRGLIRYKKYQVVALTEQWLFYEEQELDDDADLVYSEKNRVELELQRLERDEKASLERISKYADKKARGA